MRKNRMGDIEVFRLLHGKLRNLPRGQKVLAEFVGTHFDETAFLTAAELAERSGTSESTVIRLCRALGYDGFPEFQRSMQAVIRQKLAPADRMQRVGPIPVSSEVILDRTVEKALTNIRETRRSVSVDLLEAAAVAITSAERVYIVGLRASAGIAVFIGHQLGLILPHVHVLAEGGPVVFESLVSLAAKDALLAASFPRYTRWTVDSLRVARERGAATIAITDSQFSPAAQMAEIALVARPDSLTFANSYVTAMLVVDALIALIFSLRREASLAQLDAVEQLLKGQGFFYQSEGS